MSKKTSIIFFSIAFLLLPLVSCTLFKYLNNYENTTKIMDSTYSFNSSTIIQQIKLGNKDIFTIQEEQNTLPNKHQDNTPRLTQADYFLIADSISEYTWNDSIYNWKFEILSFGLACNETLEGPRQVGMKIYNLQDNSGVETRIVRYINIDKFRNTINTSEIKINPNNETLSSIEIENLNINIEKALSIAEVNGGSAIRDNVNNNCTINASFNINSYHPGWFISYSSNSNQANSELLWLVIDVESGKVTFLPLPK
jgi:hypothetical protein